MKTIAECEALAAREWEEMDETKRQAWWLRQRYIESRVKLFAERFRVKPEATKGAKRADRS